VNGPLSVAVVIPTAGGRAVILERSLRALLDDPMTHEVVVVADGVDPATEMIVRRASVTDSRVRIIPAIPDTKRLDRGQANRVTGVRATQCELILALDDDVEPETGLVSGHAARQSGSERLVVLGYMPVAAAAGRSGAVRATARLYGDAYERETRRYETDPDSILLSLWAGNVSMRRQAWLATADPPPVGAYHADRELGLRLRALGLEAVFDRRLRAVHHYQRTAVELLDDAVSSGIGQVEIQARGHERSRPIVLDVPSGGRRSLLWRGRSRRRTLAIGRCLALAANYAALAHLDRAERWLVRAVWAVGFGRGVYEAMRGPIAARTGRSTRPPAGPGGGDR
jgi:GT2 family glycosyltransferase